MDVGGGGPAAVVGGGGGGGAPVPVPAAGSTPFMISVFLAFVLVWYCFFFSHLNQYSRFETFYFRWSSW